MKFTLVDERAIALHSITDHSLLVLLLPALAPGATILGKVEREHLAYEAVCIGALRVVGADADEGVGVCVELVLEGDHDDVHSSASAVTDIRGDLAKDECGTLDYVPFCRPPEPKISDTPPTWA